MTVYHGDAGRLLKRLRALYGSIDPEEIGSSLYLTIGESADCIEARQVERDRLKSTVADLNAALKYLVSESEDDMDDDYNPHAGPLALANAAIARANEEPKK